MAPDPLPARSTLVDSLTELGRTALALARTRLEIIGTEIEEERIRLVQLALTISAIVFCFQVAVLLFVSLVVALLWEAGSLWLLGGVAAVFLIAGLVGLAVLRRRLRRLKAFTTSIAELLKDEAQLAMSRDGPSPR